MDVLIVMCFESFRNSNHSFQLAEFKPILYNRMYKGKGGLTTAFTFVAFYKNFLQFIFNFTVK